MTRTYPDEAVGGFPQPPREITDHQGRRVVVSQLTDIEPLVSMYREFDPSQRAQGIPPGTEAAIREWLDSVTGPDAVNVVADLGDEIIGHAMLVGSDAPELAIFVHQEFQGEGIGTELLRTTLGVAAAAGIECIWLVVERWNHAAMALYEKVGFEPTASPHFEREMTIRLDTDREHEG